MLKIKGSYETEAYVSEGGYYVIKQTDLCMEDHNVCLTPDQMRLLVEHMTETLKDTSWSSLQE